MQLYMNKGYNYGQISVLYTVCDRTSEKGNKTFYSSIAQIHRNEMA